MNRKYMVWALAMLMTAGCTKNAFSSSVSSQKTEDTPIETEHRKGNSLHPNEITDYDRAAITSLINMDLRDRFGKNGYETVYADNISFSKANDIIHAEGNYICYAEGYEVLGFSYFYTDEAMFYTMESADVGREPGNGDTENTNPFGREPDLSYDITIVNYVTISFTHSGEGMCRIILLDETGNLIEEVLNQEGDIDIEKKVKVPSWGNYKLQLYSTSGACSLYYSCSEE